MRDVLTSAEVARLAGVGPTAVKRWADAGVLPCIRTAGGHRRFRPEDVERFLARAAAVPSGSLWGAWIDTLLHDVDTYAVLALLYGERAQRGAWHEVAHHLGDLLVEVGRRWEAGTLSVLDEHVISASLHRGLSAVIDRMPVDPDAPRCLLASVESDEHTLGLSLAELCLHEAGWRSEWAGARTPVDTLAARIARGDLAMVALSASAAVADASLLERVAAEARVACTAAGVRLVLGGSGPWPDALPDVRRFHDLRAFHAFALAEGSRPAA